MKTEQEILKEIKHSRELKETNYYQIPHEWVSKWKKYLKGGPHPGILLKCKIEKVQIELLKTKDVYLAQSDFDVLYSIYGKLVLSAGDENFVVQQECETPTSSPVELKLTRNFKLPVIKKPGTFDNVFTTLSTTPSIKRSLSALGSLVKQTGNGSQKVVFWCEGEFSILNSILYILFHIQTLNDYFIDRYFSGNFNSRPISTYFAQMFLTKSMIKTGKINTSNIKNYLKNAFPHLTELSVIEIFKTVFDELIEEYQENDIIVQHVFNGKLVREITCLECEMRKESEERFSHLSLEVCKSLERSFEIFNREDRISNFCIYCNSFTNTSQRLTVTQNPTFLIIELKRFIQSPYPHKNNLISEISEFLIVNSEKYQLRAMIYHDGDFKSTDYILYFRQLTKWVEVKEKKVVKVKTEDVLSLPGLIYIFEKESS